MIKRPNTNAQRLKRHKRVRGKISGTPECPRLNVFRSNANIYAQLIDDVNGVTLAAANTLEKGFEGATGNAEAVAQSCPTLRHPMDETPWTAAYQAPPSMGFSRQEYWSGVP